VATRNKLTYHRVTRTATNIMILPISLPAVSTRSIPWGLVTGRCIRMQTVLAASLSAAYVEWAFFSRESLWNRPNLSLSC
jgi:hypothetical protein